MRSYSGTTSRDNSETDGGGFASIALGGTSKEGLEIRVEPGNMWGPANNASNILARPMSVPESGSLQISVTVSNSPTEQYEQVDLVWYYDDSRTVKLGLESVDGRLCIVMGREEGDKTRTIAIIPIAVGEVDLRIAVRTAGIRGFFRPADTKESKLAGECDLAGRTEPKVSLQLYQRVRAERSTGKDSRVPD
jgi:hypothetical protein